MRKILLLTILLTGLFISSYAARPTKHASNLSISNITCHSLQINWTNGNGNARLIVGREGAPTSYVPSDYVPYSANPHFGESTNYSGEFIVYNGGGLNYVVIDSLKTGKTYYFTIYEHDNNGTNTLYYTSSAPGVYDSTYGIQPDFKIIAYDSCEAHNRFTFVNTSHSTIPGVTYLYNFGDGSTSSLDSAIHIYTNKNGLIVVNLTASPGLGCKNNKSKNIRIYPRKNAYIDHTSFQDTQCLKGNFFLIDPQPIISQLPKSFVYNWNVGDGSPITTNKKLKYSYQKPGHYHVELEMPTYVNQKPTGCKDTLRFDVEVLPGPTNKTGISDSMQCLKNNLFSFYNDDNSSSSYLWQFGDGQTSSLRKAQHIYNNSGTYPIIHTTTIANGCKTSDTLSVKVLKALNSSFSGLDTAYCPNSSSITLNPTIAGGTFRGYEVNGNLLTPKIPGKYTLTYSIYLSNCSDSSAKNFRIRVAPTPFLGKDTLISNTQTLTLDAGNATGYLWSTNATTRTLSIDGKTAPKGTTKYSVGATSSEGCTGYDTIAVSVDFKTSIYKRNTTSIQIYPNPVTNVLNIKSNGLSEFEWTLYNATGKKILSGNQERLQVDFSEKAIGIYILEIRNNEGIQQLKFIKL